jgi:hypothetical protein
MPEDNAPLSLDSAISLLSVPAGQADEATLEVNTAAMTAAEREEAAKNSAAPEGDNSTPAHGDTPPADDVAANDTPADQGETNEGEADPGDALPPIDPPSSWSTEEKAEWASLSRKAQETILRREQDATKALRNAQNSTAESNKKVDAEVTRLKELSGKIDGYLNEKVAELAKDFPEIRSEADLIALAQTDPAKAQLFQVRLQAIASANTAKADAQRELSQRAQEAQKVELAQTREKLLAAFPAWKDAEVARREVTELQDYVVKNYGVDEAAARASVDPIAYKLAQKAMLYDRAQAAAKAAQQRTPPKTVKPGAQTGNPATAGKDEIRRTQMQKLEKSGDIDDAVGLLRM